MSSSHTRATGRELPASGHDGLITRSPSIPHPVPTTITYPLPAAALAAAAAAAAAQRTPLHGAAAGDHVEVMRAMAGIYQGDFRKIVRRPDAVAPYP